MRDRGASPPREALVNRVVVAVGHDRVSWVWPSGGTVAAGPSTDACAAHHPEAEYFDV